MLVTQLPAGTGAPAATNVTPPPAPAARLVAARLAHTGANGASKLASDAVSARADCARVVWGASGGRASVMRGPTAGAAAPVDCATKIVSVSPALVRMARKR